jgi:hypothetical protein
MCTDAPALSAANKPPTVVFPAPGGPLKITTSPATPET